MAIANKYKLVTKILSACDPRKMIRGVPHAAAATTPLLGSSFIRLRFEEGGVSYFSAGLPGRFFISIPSVMVYFAIQDGFSVHDFSQVPWHFHSGIL